MCASHRLALLQELSYDNTDSTCSNKLTKRLDHNNGVCENLVEPSGHPWSRRYTCTSSKYGTRPRQRAEITRTDADFCSVYAGGTHVNFEFYYCADCACKTEWTADGDTGDCVHFWDGGNTRFACM